MARDHFIKGEGYVTDAITGFVIRESDAVQVAGKWRHKSRVDVGAYVPAPRVGWITNRWKSSEYGLLTEIEEQGTFGHGNSEYGVLTEFRGSYRQKAGEGWSTNLSGDFGTMTFIPDYRA